MKYVTILVFLSFSLINTQITYAVSAVPVPASTTAAQPRIAPIPTQVGGATVNTQQSYMQSTIPPSVMSNLPAFLADINNNLCSSTAVSQGRPCFIQYMVKQHPQGKTFPYIVVNNSLQCPETYIPALTLGNSALDKDHPTDKIFYYAANTMYKVTPAQYKIFKKSGNCMPGVYKHEDKVCSWEHCSWGFGTLDEQNGETYTDKMDSNYELFVRAVASESKPTYNRGVNNCQYDLTDESYGTCHTSIWCDYCPWYYYMTWYVNCDVPAGYYFYDPTNPNANNYDSSYTPSTVICVKPEIKWMQRSIAPASPTPRTAQ